MTAQKRLMTQRERRRSVAEAFWAATLQLTVQKHLMTRVSTDAVRSGGRVPSRSSRASLPHKQSHKKDSNMKIKRTSLKVTTELKQNGTRDERKETVNQIESVAVRVPSRSSRASLPNKQQHK
jgi:hypothetical protein